MIKEKGIGRIFSPALAAVATVALLLVSMDTAAAQPKVGEATKAFCDWQSAGNKALAKKCLEDARKSKERLKGIRIEPDEDEFCRNSTLGNYAQYEKCINSVTRSDARKKRKELKEEIEKRKEMKDARAGKRSGGAKKR